MRTLLRFMYAVNISGAVVATLAALALLLGSTSAADASHLAAPANLVCDATAGLEAGALAGFVVNAKVKALDPGNNKGRQNHGFSPESFGGAIS